MINDLPGELGFNARGVEREIECPDCGEWLTYGENQVSVTCPDCQIQWNIDADAEFVNGSWHDLTHLYK